MRVLICAVILIAVSCLYCQTIHATFDGVHWSCSAGTDMYANETEAIEGKDFVYCTR